MTDISEWAYAQPGTPLPRSYVDSEGQRLRTARFTVDVFVAANDVMGLEAEALVKARELSGWQGEMAIAVPYKAARAADVLWESTPVREAATAGCSLYADITVGGFGSEESL